MVLPIWMATSCGRDFKRAEPLSVASHLGHRTRLMAVMCSGSNRKALRCDLARRGASAIKTRRYPLQPHASPRCAAVRQLKALEVA